MSNFLDMINALIYDLSEVANNFKEFLDTFFNDVMNSNFTSLIMYLWYCIPSFIRMFMFFGVGLFVILNLFLFFKHTD